MSFRGITGRSSSDRQPTIEAKVVILGTQGIIYYRLLLSCNLEIRTLDIKTDMYRGTSHIREILGCRGLSSSTETV